MPNPPLRKGLDPLIRMGLIKSPLSFDDDHFLQFLVFCEMLYRENLALKNQLRKYRVDPEKYLSRQAFPPGSPGQHRTVFDGWYAQIAKDLQTRISVQEGTKTEEV
jgi:hypothetical protein